MADRDSVLVTGAYGLVGRPVVDRLVADGHHVIATAHHATKPALPTSVDVRSVDLTKPDQVTALLADVSPSAIVHLAAVHPTDVLRQSRARASGERRRHRVIGARRAGDAFAAAFRPRVVHGGVRQPQPAPVRRPAHARDPAVGLGAVRLSQAQGRKHSALIGFGVVDPSARRCHHPRAAGRLRRFRDLLLRRDPARGQPVSFRRRP